MRHTVRSLLFLALSVMGLLAGQSQNWVAAGNQALYAGRPTEAARDYSLALDESLRTTPQAVSNAVLLHLRVSLATAYMEAGDLHNAENALRQADEAAKSVAGELQQAQLLNAWAAVHLLEDRWQDTERELKQARGVLQHVPESGDLLPAVLHNLAAVKVRTGAYAEALNDEQSALSLWSKMLNADHPHLVKGWASLGAVQYLLGEFQEAHQSMERALAAARTTYGAKHPRVADLLESEAVVLDKLKLKRDAKLARNEAREIRGEPASNRTVRMTWNIRDALAPDSAVYVKSK